jgi:hypothetical protein
MEKVLANAVVICEFWRLAVVLSSPSLYGLGYCDPKKFNKEKPENTNCI